LRGCGEKKGEVTTKKKKYQTFHPLLEDSVTIDDAWLLQEKKQTRVPFLEGNREVAGKKGVKKYKAILKLSDRFRPNIWSKSWESKGGQLGKVKILSNYSRYDPETEKME